MIATEVLVLGSAKPAGRTTDIVVVPALTGVKFVTALSDPPGIVTLDAIEPTAAFVVLRLTVTDVPPATCSTPLLTMLLSGFSCVIETVKGEGPAATVVE